MQKINLKKLKKKFDTSRKSLRSFITRINNNLPKGFDTLMEKIDQEVWSEVNCLNCTNC